MDINSSIGSAVEYFRCGDAGKAGDICKKILKKQPDNVDALHLLGVINHQRGKLDQAMKYLKKAIEIDPKFADAYSNLGSICREQKRFDEAVQYFLKALRIDPGLAKTWLNLGMLLQDRGKLDEALTAYQQALRLNPGNSGLMNNLGVIFQKKRQWEKAIVYYRKASEIDPDYAEARYNLGNVLKETNDLDQAIAEYQDAVRINPEHAEAYNNLGLVLQKKGRFAEAEACYQKAVQINPGLVEAYQNLGNLRKDTGRTDDAVGFYRKVLELSPDNAAAYNNLGTVFKEKGKIPEAEAYYRKALQSEPDSPVYYSNLLLLMNYNPGHNAQAIFHEHLGFAKQFAEPLSSAFVPHSNDPLSSRRLRIGYVSPDFRRHSVNYFVEPVLASHNHAQFEIFCYSDVPVPDSVTGRFQGYADQWRNIVGMPDEEAAAFIRNDRIDILVDLSGHTGYNRLLLFARKPAPVQVSWIGYPNTTGLSTMDYRIVDKYTDPPGLTDPFYSERLLRLPECFLCFRPDKDSPGVGALPCLTTGQITFGSFNNFAKETPEVIGVWSEILSRIPGSRLLLKAKSFSDQGIRCSVIEMFALHGIDSERIELLAHAASFTEHLDLYNRIDIGLDPFPYNGATTTCEALWMGVPVITLAGSTHASRVGKSLLANVGLPELVAETSDAYRETAVRLAEDIGGLQVLRKKLRGMMEESALTDSKRYIEKVESLYRNIWEDWCMR